MQWAMISKELHKKTVWLFGLLAKTKSRNFICKFIGHEQQVLRTIHRKVIDVVACICNSVILEAALRNGEGSIPSGSNSPLTFDRWVDFMTICNAAQSDTLFR